MTQYTNANAQSSLAALEISSRPDGNYAFFYTHKPEEAEAVKKKLVASGLNPQILSEAQAGDKAVIIARVPESKDEMLRLLRAQGEELRAPEVKREFHPWKWRGNFSNIGQGLNLYSSISKGQLDRPKMTFAGLNLAANAVNLIFGGQKDEDVNRMRTVKEQFNEKLTAYLAPGVSLPVVDEKPAAIVRMEAKEKPLTLGQKAYGFMQRNSVLVGEIGLRYLGSLAMVFPAEQWKSAITELRKGAVVDAFKKAVNNKPDKTNLRVGVIYLIGKTIGLFSKVPDPYNPEPPSTLDTIREKLLFKVSSAIEASAAATLAHGSMKKGDTVGALGGASLVGGLSTRFFAKFGTRHVDMDEIYAHVAEGLAKVAPSKLPAAMADAATFLQEHFKDKKLQFGNAYTQLRTDLYRYHDIAVFPQAKPTVPMQEVADAAAAPAQRKWTETSRPAGEDKDVARAAAAKPPVEYTQRLQQSAANADIAMARG
jgi:hypothetical protein